MSKETEMQDTDLEDLFATARQQPVTVSPDLMARVLADADSWQPAAATLPSRARKPRLFAGFMAAIGGVGGLAGLSSAAIAGVWIGFAQPIALSSVTDAFLAGGTAAETVDILPSFDDFLSEG
ncbi:dihydroorotate dehydrogenase [Pseudorhodobacter sp.]|uniref:dihydroorotate dehydrogenase n=1 Tax=Pseudorhodobacter sp. TaxID=1934400 RepID=UPI0039E69B11